MRSVHSIRAAIAAAVLAWLPTAAAAQIVPAPPALPEANATSFSIFIGGRPLGSEQIAVNRVADGWMITSAGRINAPVDVVAPRPHPRARWRRRAPAAGPLHRRLAAAVVRLRRHPARRRADGSYHRRGHH